MRIVTMCVLALGLHALTAYGQVFRVNGSGLGDYKTTSHRPFALLRQEVTVPAGKIARIDVTGSLNWYAVPGGWCDGYVGLMIDGVAYSYLGFTDSPYGGSNDKPFHLFGYQKGDGLEHAFSFTFWTATSQCEIGIENAGTTNLVMTTVLQAQ